MKFQGILYFKEKIYLAADSVYLAHFIPISHPYTASSIAQIFFENIFKLYGMPKSIVCDRNITFTSVFFGRN